MKNIIVLLFVMGLGLGAAVFAQNAESDFEYRENGSGDFRTAIITKYKGTATQVAIPEMIDGIAVTQIDTGAFSGTGLAGLAIPASVTGISSGSNEEPVVFYGCASLAAITVDDLNSTYASVDGVLFDKSLQRLIQYPAGKKGSYTIPSSVTAIGWQAFYRGTGLTSVSIPASVAEIGRAAFAGCTSLTSVAIPNSVTVIRGGGIDNKPGTFAGCTSLTSVTIPASVTEIASSAFEGCTSLATITVDGQNSKYASMNGVLFDKDVRIIISYPAGKSGAYTIPSSVTVIGEGAFAESTGLTAVTIPNSVTEIRSGGDYGRGAFEGCTNLISVTIPASVAAIGRGAFSGCTSLISVAISSSATKMERYTFEGCTNLTSVTMPASVAGIGGSTFPHDFDSYYNDNGKKAGIYVWGGRNWSQAANASELEPRADMKPGFPPAGTDKRYRVQVGSYKVPQNAAEAFDKLKAVGLSPSYERNGDLYRVVLSGVKADDVPLVAEKIWQAGFAEALVREEF